MYNSSLRDLLQKERSGVIVSTIYAWRLILMGSYAREASVTTILLLTVPYGSKIDDHFNWYLCMYPLYERCDILLAVYSILCVGCKIILCSAQAQARYGNVCVVHNA